MIRTLFFNTYNFFSTFFQALQKDIDRLNDALEAKASEEAVLKKDLSACVLELGKCRESVEEHKSQAATLRQVKSTSEFGKTE